MIAVGMGYITMYSFLYKYPVPLPSLCVGALQINIRVHLYELLPKKMSKESLKKTLGDG